MSTLVATFLQDRATGRRLTMDNTIDGTPKMYVGFNGISMAVTLSMNVTSMSDDGVGNYHTNHTVPFATWSVPGGSCHYAGSFWAYISILGYAQYTVNCLCFNVGAPSTPADVSVCCMAASGRLA